MRKESRQQRSGRDKKQAEVSPPPPRRSRGDNLEQIVTPGSDHRLQQESSSLDYRQDGGRMSARYSGEHHRRTRGYENEEHYDRPQHPAEFDVSDRYRTDEAQLQYTDDRRRQSDAVSRRDRRDYEYESRRGGDYDHRDRDYELDQRGERYRRDVDRRGGGEWDVDDRRHSGQGASRAEHMSRSAYSDRRRGAAELERLSSSQRTLSPTGQASSAWEQDQTDPRERSVRPSV